jgi:hypothetical protein
LRSDLEAVTKKVEVERRGWVEERKALLADWEEEKKVLLAECDELKKKVTLTQEEKAMR